MCILFQESLFVGLSLKQFVKIVHLIIVSERLKANTVVVFQAFHFAADCFFSMKSETFLQFTNVSGTRHCSFVSRGEEIKI